MTTSNALRIDQMLVEELKGPDKLVALLRARGHTFVSVAKKYGMWPQHVKRTIYTGQGGEDVRQALVAELGLSRDEIDLLLTEAKEP